MTMLILAGFKCDEALIDLDAESLTIPEQQYGCKVRMPSAEFQQLLQLSRHSQVFVKTSGFGYYSAKPFPYEDCHLPLQMLLDHFGPERLIWGSDFPHILLVCGYRRAMAVIEHALPGVSARVRQQIMGDNAHALYWKD